MRRAGLLAGVAVVGLTVLGLVIFGLSELRSRGLSEPSVLGSAEAGPVVGAEAAGLLPTEFTLDFRPEACPPEFQATYNANCGRVEVPADWDDPADGQVVELAVAVFPGSGGTATAEPVVYLDGGPGSHSLASALFTYGTFIEPLRERGDVVLFDQRGTGYSSPSLECPETIELTRSLESQPDLSEDEVLEMTLASLARCRDRLVADGIDLTNFDTVNNSRDVDAIRTALGYEQWSLYGVSYGTRLGLEVLRRYPQGVRSAVLDSVYPPVVDATAENPATFAESYQKVVAACAAESACAAQGDLGERIESAVAELEANPVPVAVRNWLDPGDSGEVQVDGVLLIEVVMQALYSPTSFGDLPELVSELEAGETRILGDFLSLNRTNEQFFSTGMFFSMACRDEIAFSDLAETERLLPADPFGLKETFDYASNIGPTAFESCEAFENGRADPSSNREVRSDVPTLLLAGTYDPVTPVEWAERALETLSNGTLVVDDNGSHGVSLNPCGLSVITAFLDSPLESPDSSCFDDSSLTFVGKPTGDVELEQATRFVAESSTEITTTRPADWEVGSLGGDQYRSASFTDPTELLQLVENPTTVDAIADFVNDSHSLELGPASAFAAGETVGSLDASELEGSWRRRRGSSESVTVDWFETDYEESRVIVVLVAPLDESDELTESVLVPALLGITVQSVDA